MPRSELSAGAVRVGPVLHRYDGDNVGHAVDDAEVATPCAAEAFEFEPKRFADAVQIGRQRPVDQLDHGRANLGGQPDEGTAGSRGPADVERLGVHRRSSPSACSLVRTPAWS